MRESFLGALVNVSLVFTGLGGSSPTGLPQNGMDWEEGSPRFVERRSLSA